MRAMRSWPALLLVASLHVSTAAALPHAPEVGIGEPGTFIDIAVSDSGTNVFFHGEAPRDTVRIVASVEGPRWNEVDATELDRIVGLWLPWRSCSLMGVPSFYHVSASCPSCNGLSQCEHRLDLRSVNEILAPYDVVFGPAWIRRTVDVVGIPSRSTDQAILDELWRWGLDTGRYRIRENAIRINSQAVFYHVLELPDRAPEGHYNVVTAFLGEDHVVEVVRNSFDLRRPGSSAWILRMSREHPWTYGVASLMLMIACGFAFSGRSLLRRDTHQGPSEPSTPATRRGSQN